MNSFPSPAESWRALQTGAVAVAAPWRRRLRVTGSDAGRWLNGMVTNNTAALAEGEGNYSFLLNNQGRIQADLTAFRLGDGYVLETAAEQAETVLAWLDRYIIMDDVVLETGSAQPETVMLAGVTAPAILRELGLDGDTLAPLQLWTGPLQTAVQGETTVYRDPVLRIPAFWIWCDAPAQAALLDALQANGVAPCHPEALEWLRIASGVPAFGRDITAKDLPQETGQTRALHFQKGCYLGQEIVERIHSRGNVHRGLTGFAFDAPVGEGTPVLDGEAEIGVLTSVASFPEGAPDAPRDRTAGFGIVRLAAVAARKPLTAAGQPAVPQPLPFL